MVDSHQRRRVRPLMRIELGLGPRARR